MTERPAKMSLAEALVSRHRFESSGQPLITISSSSPGVASYMIASAPDTSIKDVRDELGGLSVRWGCEEFGEIVSRISAGAVVEIACHDTEQQRDAYREQCKAIDAENRDLFIESMSGFAATLVKEMGGEIAVEPESDDDEEPQE